MGRSADGWQLLPAMDGVFLRYLRASAVALGMDLAIFLTLLRLAVPAMPSAVAAYALGIVVHWIASSRKVFGDAVAAAGPRRAQQKASFVATALLGLALTSAITGYAATIALDPQFAKLAAVAASFVMTWSLRSRLVFAGAFPIERG